ncbi:MAG: hypothetical protein JXA82_10290 [Sedimentisphaerales bacterium]|nr:hypothetical protein [Sedimentisphaerales bacterium]
MSRFFRYLWRKKKIIGVVLLLIVVGGFFRWEVREVDDAKTGAPIVRSRGIVFPWQECGMSTGGNRLVNFHVRHWLCYGLVKVEATGQTDWGTNDNS